MVEKIENSVINDLAEAKGKPVSNKMSNIEVVGACHRLRDEAGVLASYSTFAIQKH